MRGQLVVLVGISFTCCLTMEAWAQSSQGDSQATSAAAGIPQSPVADQTLPWLPGLGQQHAQTNLDPRFAQPNPVNPPPQAQPIPGAQPLNTVASFTQPAATQPEPKSVLARPSEWVRQVPDVPAVAPSHSVIPAAFVDDEESAATPPPSTQQPSNQQIVDSQITRVTKGLQQLPNTAGQVWRTYDISPYTNRVQNNARPQQAVIDWILKETGKDLWFTEPMGILNASRTELHVYHTPAIQARIKSLVDRFVHSQGQAVVVGLQLMTIGSPNWRTSAISMMQPIDVAAPGIEAWLMSKENAALLVGMLRSRGDYQPRNSGDLVVVNGQQYTLSQTQPVEFARSIGIVNEGGVARYQPLMDRIDHGFTLDFSALTSLDGRTIEAIIGCEINQVEGAQTVNLELPTASGQTQPYQLQIPQMVSWDIRERFRWPSDMVLVLSAGVVATPGPQRESLFGLTSLLNGTRGRADALMFVEFKGAAQGLPGARPPATSQIAPGAGVAGQTPVLQPPPRR